MKNTLQNIYSFFSVIWKGVLGIYIEVIFTLAVMLAGFLICVFWWGIAR